MLQFGDLIWDCSSYKGKKVKIIDIMLAQEIVIIDERVEMILDDGKRKLFIVDFDEISINEILSGLSKVTRIESINIWSIEGE